MDIKKIELIREEEQKLSFYRDYLHDLVGKRQSKIFTNKGEAHASILMATLIANTKRNLDMYCTGLRPGILCGVDENDPVGFRGSYWSEFQRFFSKTILSPNFKGGSIRILVQTKDHFDKAPFRVVSEALNNLITKHKIKVALIDPKSKKRIETILGKLDNDNPEVNYNFSIFDNEFFRLEYEANSYRALGSFNSPSWCEILSCMFEIAFNEAVDITSEVEKLTKPLLLPQSCVELLTSPSIDSQSKTVSTDSSPSILHPQSCGESPINSPINSQSKTVSTESSSSIH